MDVTAGAVAAADPAMEEAVSTTVLAGAMAGRIEKYQAGFAGFTFPCGS